MGEDTEVGAIADAGDLLAEKIDVLLERLTDRVLATPVGGAPDWYRQWIAHTSAHGQCRRVLVRIAIASRAGIDPVHDIARARAAGVDWAAIGRAAGLSARAARRRWTVTPIRRGRQPDPGQLTMW